MSTAIQTKDDPAAIIERVVTVGDLAKLTPAERITYYNEVCRSIGLNPLTRPFEFITLNSKLTLYARKDCTDQLRKMQRVSVKIVARDMHETVGLYVVTASASTPDGRTDESIGAVSIAGLRADALANALMKAETKAKRRVTLSFCGLGWLDESEIDSIPDARPVAVAPTGEIEAPDRAQAHIKPTGAKMAGHAFMSSSGHVDCQFCGLSIMASIHSAHLREPEDSTPRKSVFERDAPDEPAEVVPKREIRTAAEAIAVAAMTLDQEISLACIKAGINDKLLEDFLLARFGKLTIADVEPAKKKALLPRLKAENAAADMKQWLENKREATPSAF